MKVKLKEYKMYIYVLYLHTTYTVIYLNTQYEIIKISSSKCVCDVSVRHKNPSTI